MAAAAVLKIRKIAISPMGRLIIVMDMAIPWFHPIMGSAKTTLGKLG